MIGKWAIGQPAGMGSSPPLQLYKMVKEKAVIHVLFGHLPKTRQCPSPI